MDIGMIGAPAALAFSAIGPVLGSGTAGMAAIGAWKRCYVQNRVAPFLLVAFVGAPLSQTIYGMILMNAIKGSHADPMLRLGAGVIGGIAIGYSAWYQGKCGASGSDALAETGKGFANYIMVLGIAETVALFVLVFLLMVLG